MLSLVPKNAAISEHNHCFLVFLHAIVLTTVQQQLMDRWFAFERAVASTIAAVFV